jgi:precorrin-4 methylase
VAEPTPKRLQETVEKFGFTEREARIYLHLEEAEKLFAELAKENDDDPVSDLARIVWVDTHTREHFQALYRRLGIRVLRRRYPQGWGYLPPENEDRD